MPQKSKPSSTPRHLSGIAAIGARAGSKGVSDSLNVSGRTARRWLKQIASGKVSAETSERMRAAYKTREAAVARSKGYAEKSTPPGGRHVSPETRAKISASLKAYHANKERPAVVREMLAAGARILENPETWKRRHHILRPPGSTLKDAAQALKDSGIAPFCDFYKDPRGRYQIVVWDERSDGKTHWNKGKDRAEKQNRTTGSDSGSTFDGGGGGGGGSGGGSGGGAGAGGSDTTGEIDREGSDDPTDLYGPEYDQDDGEESDYKDVGAS